MKFSLKITISLKKGMLDPEALAIKHALDNLSFNVESLGTARVFFIEVDESSEDAARQKGQDMCDRLLANPVIHSYEIEVSGV
ncbi:phosphoribosylformylglycinamidine synthase, purS [Methanolacinia petrolearia DSM 11571]|uniref:Phosphoribosylformylglycinamidine synthase subunit PurS n=1 Tax=Methanolacinia petrolearia (strain DSM 11571 / OCM 486 / SEBR 4847) TaxID=679926 RepID=E1RIH7_METP4|nr:phosphoribosylformylglycinamidine synthase subunit PurS [Methanolacinia petrolearia]ADN35490.1 phosphoribosylformylglycinamidine synthase, purS [Methanolacinia petrolearia DSM 11571]